MQLETPLVEISAIPASAQTQSPSCMVCTEQYIIYTSTHSIYVYQRFPQILFVKAIQINHTLIAALTANEQFIAAACMDMKIHFYDLKTFEPTREVLLARDDPPISVQFHPHFNETILLLYQGDDSRELLGELRSINIITGQSFTLVTSLEDPINMVCSPHRSEIAILSDDGHLRLYGIDRDGTIIYERMVLMESLRIFQENSPLAAEVREDKSEISKRTIKLINDYLDEARSEGRSVACRQLSYDPKVNDYYVVCWECGLHALFSSKTGQALQIFEPQKTGIMSIIYSPIVSGKFYTTEANSGIYREWNVSQQRCTQEIRISPDQLTRIFINQRKEEDKVYDVLHFIDVNGRLFVVEAGKVLFESVLNHSQAVLDIDITKDNKNQFITASNDGNCRIWSFMNFNGYKSNNGVQNTISLRSTNYDGQNNSIDSEVDKDACCVCACYMEDLIVCGYDNGLICCSDGKTGRPINNIFTPSIQLKYNFADSINEFVQDIENLEQAKGSKPHFSKLKCMLYNDGYIYSGWRDSCIRIMKVSIISSATLGTFVSSFFVSEFSVLKLCQLNPDLNCQITALKTIDDSLYVTTSCGLFFVFDLIPFKNAAQSVKDVKLSDLSLVKTTAKYFTDQKYFCGNLNPKIQQDQIVTSIPKPKIDGLINNRIFNDIDVSKPNQEEIQYIQKQENTIPSKIINLVDNYGIHCTLYQIGTKPSEMAFKIVSVHAEEFQDVDRTNTDKNMGIKFTKAINIPFHVVIGGAEGCLAIVNWKNQPRCKIQTRLKSTKSDFSCCKLINNLILAGCYDGSLKLISFMQTGISCQNLVQNYLGNFVSNADIASDILQQQYFEEIYQTQTISNIIESKLSPFAKNCPLDSDNLLKKAKILLYLISNQFLQIIASQPGDLLENLIAELSKQYEINQPSELYEKLLQLMGSDLSMYNMYLCLSTPNNKLKVQQMFQCILNIAYSLLDFQFIAKVLWIVGMYNQAVQVSTYGGKQFFGQIAKKVFYLRCSAQDTQNQIFKRWDLEQYYDDEYIQQIRTCNKLKENFQEDLFKQFVEKEASKGHYYQIKLIAKQFNQHTSIISQQIAQYYCSVGLPLLGAQELLTELLYDEVIRILLFAGENLLLYYVLSKIEQIGFDQFRGLRICILGEWIYKIGNMDMIRQFQKAVSEKDMQLEADHTGIFIHQKIKVSDFLGLWTLDYDNALAAKGKTLINQELKTEEDFYAAAHFIRKMCCSEYLNSNISIDSMTQQKTQLNEQQFEEYLRVQSMNSGKEKFLVESNKVLQKMMSQISVDEGNIHQLSGMLCFLSKHFLITHIQSEETLGGPSKQPEIHLLLLSGACLVAKSGSIRGTRVFLSASLRVQRKMNLRALPILTVLQQQGVSGSYDTLRGKDNKYNIQYNGRSIFELLEMKMFNIFTPFDRGMNWVKGYFG